VRELVALIDIPIDVYLDCVTVSLHTVRSSTRPAVDTEHHTRVKVSKDKEPVFVTSFNGLSFQ